MTDHRLAERVAAVRRDHILDAATRVFAARGFNVATVRDVAREAGVADGTIYNYFENKDALLFGIFDRLNESERRQQDLAAPPDADRTSFVRAYVRHRFDIFERIGFDAFQVLISELLVNTDLRARYVREILEPTFAVADAAIQQSGGDTRTEAEQRLAIRAQAALVLGCLVLRLMGEPLVNEHWEAVPDLIADMILRSQGGQHAPDTSS